MTTEEKIDRLTGIVESLAASVVAHDNQIERLIEMAAEYRKTTANLEKQWQAYLNTLPRS